MGVQEKLSKFFGQSLLGVTIVGEFVRFPTELNVSGYLTPWENLVNLGG